MILQQFEMRRRDRQIEDSREVDSILNRAQVGRIGMSLSDQPYVVPVNFLYSGGKIYFHSANEGQMYTYLKANNKVCFEVDEPGETVPNVDPCKFSFKYKSIIAFGKTRFLQNPEEKLAILAALVEKYDKNKVATKEVTIENLEDVEVGEIAIERMTGKTNAP
jgi:hypothetical protein